MQKDKALRGRFPLGSCPLADLEPEEEVAELDNPNGDLHARDKERRVKLQSAAHKGLKSRKRMETVGI